MLNKIVERQFINIGAKSNIDQKQYKNALVEFRKVVDNHPEGNKVPDALLKLGYCYSQLGDGDKARSVWQQILRVYPKSNPASLAKTKLAEL